VREEKPKNLFTTHRKCRDNQIIPAETKNIRKKKEFQEANVH